MNEREFNLSLIPGLERPLTLAKLSLDRVNEDLFKDWAKQFPALPEAMLREQYRIRGNKLSG